MVEALAPAQVSTRVPPLRPLERAGQGSGQQDEWADARVSAGGVDDRRRRIHPFVAGVEVGHDGRGRLDSGFRSCRHQTMVPQTRRGAKDYPA